MQSVTHSHKGNKSDTNEDACLAIPSRGLFVVADGVGGGPSGDFASRLVVDTVYESFKNSTVSVDAILESIQNANSYVYDAALTENRKGMASTVVVGWIHENKLHCFNVGDSRIYRLRGSRLELLTRDQTRQIQKAPNIVKQVITNAVGIKPDIRVEVTDFDCEVGDLLLLMSDGISDLLDEDSITIIVSSSQFSLADKAKALVHESEKRGGQDDKSVILALVN